MEITPDAKKVLDNLVFDIVNTHNTHLTSGIVGAKFLLPTLSKLGKGDIALNLLK